MEESETYVICNNANAASCPAQLQTVHGCVHAEPHANKGMLGITGTCPDNSKIHVEIIEARPKGDPNMAFVLRKK